MKRSKRTVQTLFQPVGCFFAVALVVISTASATGAPPLVPVRERLSLNSNWRFAKGDPANAGDQLSYTNIKAWVAVTGAKFTTNSQSLQRPQGNIGDDVATWLVSHGTGLCLAQLIDRLHPAVDMQFLVNLVQIPTDRAYGDGKFIGHLLAGVTIRYKPENLPFSW